MDKTPSSPLDQEVHRGPVAWMAGNPIAANILMLILLVGGLIMAMRVTKDVFPEFDLGTITISVSYPGATPEEISNSITQTIEEAISDVDGITEIKSKTNSGSTTITLELDESFNDNTILQEVQAEVDRITTFPEEAEEPNISLLSRNSQVLRLMLYGDADEHILRYWADIIDDNLATNPFVSQVEIDGIRDREIQIEIPQDSLRRYALTLNDVSEVIRKHAVEQGGGTLRTSAGDILMNIDERHNYAQEFSTIPVFTYADGSQVFLSDIATVKEAFEDTNIWAEYDGYRAISISVLKSDQHSPVEVTESVISSLEQFNAMLPEGLTLDVLNNRGEIYEARESLLISNAIMGVILVFLCLALFLHPALAFWVSLGIPISILGSFFFFPPFDLTINMISMFAFIVTLGIVVDDAIVVGENISAWQENGYDSLEGAVKGVKEVSVPVVFSVLTNIIAFLPIAFVPGIMGKIWIALPLIVIAVFTCSLIESLFILPAHLAHSIQKQQKKRTSFLGKINHAIISRQQVFNRKFMYFVEYRFGAFLRFALGYKYITMAISIAILLLASSYAISGRLGFQLMPRSESDYAYASITLPTGSPKSELIRIKDYYVAKAQEVIDENGKEELAEGIYTFINTNTIQISAFLTDDGIRPISTMEFTKKWSEKAPLIAGVETIEMQSDRGGPGSGKGLSVDLYHRDSLVLEQAAFNLAERLQGYAGISDVDTGTSETKRQFDLKLLPIAKQLGFTAADVASQVRASFEGSIAMRQQRGNDEITIRVLFPEEDRKLLSSYENLILRSPNNQEVYLRDIVETSDTQADAVINRTNGKLSVSVSANITPDSATGLMMGTIENDLMPEVMALFPGLAWSFGGHQQDIQDSVDTMIVGLICAVLGIYALLAIPFKSYSQPFIIMLSIPFGIVGAFLGHIIMGYSLSVISIFGIVALSGVIVNDSLVLIDFANIQRRAGMNHFDSICMAAIRRFRPIILTTLTTFLGLMPIIFETSRQAKMMIPVALSLGFGILFATFICLVIIPSYYLIFEDIRVFFSKEEEYKS